MEDDGEQDATTQDADKRGGARGPPAIQYHLRVGREQIQYAQPPTQQAHLPKNSLQYVSFFGKCYHCKYSAHSQKYCPLRQCQRCKQYGHSENVCWTLSCSPPLPPCAEMQRYPHTKPQPYAATRRPHSESEDATDTYAAKVRGGGRAAVTPVPAAAAAAAPAAPAPRGAGAWPAARGTHRAWSPLQSAAGAPARARDRSPPPAAGAPARGAAAPLHRYPAAPGPEDSDEAASA